MIFGIYAVGGVPGSGKSTLFKGLVAMFSGRYPQTEWGEYRLGKLTQNFQNLDPIDEGVWFHVLGSGYTDPNAKFPGTDLLSMAVQPDAVEVLKKMNADDQFHWIYFEGDRLFNNSFLTDVVALVDDRLHVIFLGASAESLSKRHIQRDDTQTKQFLKSRDTKYRNIQMNLDLMGCIERYANEEPSDLARIAKIITPV